MIVYFATLFDLLHEVHIYRKTSKSFGRLIRASFFIKPISSSNILWSCGFCENSMICLFERFHWRHFSIWFKTSSPHHLPCNDLSTYSTNYECRGILQKNAWHVFLSYNLGYFDEVLFICVINSCWCILKCRFKSIQSIKPRDMKNVALKSII